MGGRAAAPDDGVVHCPGGLTIGRRSGPTTGMAGTDPLLEISLMRRRVAGSAVHLVGV